MGPPRARGFVPVLVGGSGCGPLQRVRTGSHHGRMSEALSREAVRELDRRAIEELGVPSLLLMENAGRACADVIERRLGGGPALCLCGPGNNGGDGLVIARTLWNRGHEARALFLGDVERHERCSEDVRTNARLWRTLGRELELVEPAAGAATLRSILDDDRPAVLVDALFGTGLTRELRSPWSELVEAMNAARVPICAVDVPSGLDADTGQVLGAAVRAVSTVSFVAPKLGFTRGAGPQHCGEIRVAEIGIPRCLYE